MRVICLGVVVAVALAGLIGASLSPVRAQQPANQVVPSTHNPQLGPIQPSQLRGGLQEAGSTELLRNDRQIILSGRPAPPSPPTENLTPNHQPRWPVIAALAVLGLLGLGLFVGRREVY